MDATTPNREIVEVFEIRQPRCGLRFGVAPCTASAASKCYNTLTTCGDTANYTPTGSIAWRFSKPGVPVPDTYEIDGQDIATNCIPCLANVSTSPSRINIGATRDGESPFGVRGQVTANFVDIPWDDHVGDFYLADRASVGAATFWALFKARNRYTFGMETAYYVGYRGDALADMKVRRDYVTRIDGPNFTGATSVVAVDPLQFADRRRALFPRPSNITLKDDINSSTTTVSVYSSEADLSDDFGNTGSTRFIRVGDEIMRYTGYTLVDAVTGEYSLSGVLRERLGTTSSSHDAGDAMQRVGRYADMVPWQIAEDLLENHTPMPSGLINISDWNAEGSQYIGSFTMSGTVATPTPVETLCGELVQQGLFSLFWDDQSAEIKMLAIRPSPSVIALSEETNIKPGAKLVERPEERLTRVLVYYSEKDPTKSKTDIGNYRKLDYIGKLEEETEERGGEVRTKTIFSRWINTTPQAVQLSQRTLNRYVRTPRYMTIQVDAKDGAIKLGDIVSVDVSGIVDPEGNPVVSEWQVIAIDEAVPGDTYVLDLQTFSLVGRLGFYMGNSAPVYSAASDAEKEAGAWYCNDDGLMGDGSEPYRYQ